MNIDSNGKSRINVVIMFFLILFGFKDRVVFAMELNDVPLTLGRSDTIILPVPDTGWRMLKDERAPWKGEAVYLPEDVHLDKIPTNPPTDGWNILTDEVGIPVVLPATVEGYEGCGPNHDQYKGVSWWWRSLDVPDSFNRKTVVLHIRGANRLAEVYFNRKLVGYNFVGETAFDCDLTQYLKPGQVNQLAIRITNPGGLLGFPDDHATKWGDIWIPETKAFGGLDRGMTLTAHDPVYLSDAWTLNTPEFRTVSANAEIRNGTNNSVTGTLLASVIDPKTGETLAEQNISIEIPAGANKTTQVKIDCPKAELWSLHTPRLYTMHYTFSAEQMTDTRDVTFGFRWFTPDGIGKKAVLRLNGERIRLFSAISWGFWGINGMFPTRDLAVKEVMQAKNAGLNCLSFHRHYGKTEVLDAQDELGLLRYMEPGAGRFAVGPQKGQYLDYTPIVTSFMNRYEQAKITSMMRDFRSHPSLVIYNIQNEWNPDINDPRLIDLLQRMHKEDPSRTIVVGSGIKQEHQAFMLPYDDRIYSKDDRGYVGWQDFHTVGTPDGVWNDSYYKSPDDRIYKTTNSQDVVDWGEMGGSTAPDDNAEMVEKINRQGGHSYDLQDHLRYEAVYQNFLDKAGFRSAFPTTTDLYHSIGDKQFEYWSNVIQAARLSDDNDILTISGWETTSLDDRGGLVDNLRDYHGNPAILRVGLAPVLASLMARRSAVTVGGAVPYDLYLLNETNRSESGMLRVSLTDPNGKDIELGKYPAPTLVKDKFVYSIQTGLLTPPLNIEGVYKLSCTFENHPAAGQTRELRAIGVRKLSNVRVGLLPLSEGGLFKSDLAQMISKIPGAAAEPYRIDGQYDVILACDSDAANGWAEVTSQTISNTEDPPLFQHQVVGKQGSCRFVFRGLQPGPAKVTLNFAEIYWDKKDARRFDVLINGQTVIKNLDICAEAGGPFIALTKTFEVNAPAGIITIEPGNATIDNPLFAAIKVESGNKVQAFTMAQSPYTDKVGQVWEPYRPYSEAINSTLLSRVWAGLPLIIATSDKVTLDALAHGLDAAGVLKYSGLLGYSAPWMGNWCFLKAHPIYDSMPVNEAMHGDYQVEPSVSDGLYVEAPGLEIITALARPECESLRFAAGDFILPWGKGRILFHTLSAMQPAFQQRWLANSLDFVAESASANNKR